MFDLIAARRLACWQKQRVYKLKGLLPRNPDKVVAEVKQKCFPTTQPTPRGMHPHQNNPLSNPSQPFLFVPLCTLSGFV